MAFLRQPFRAFSVSGVSYRWEKVSGCVFCNPLLEFRTFNVSQKFLSSFQHLRARWCFVGPYSWNDCHQNSWSWAPEEKKETRALQGLICVYVYTSMFWFRFTSGATVENYEEWNKSRANASSIPRTCFSNISLSLVVVQHWSILQAPSGPTCVECRQLSQTCKMLKWSRKKENKAAYQWQNPASRELVCKQQK